MDDDLHKQNDFVLNLERATKIVLKWPEWKQRAWGPIITGDKDKIMCERTNDLSDFSTEELTNELVKRNGITKITVSPYEDYEIKTNDTCIKDNGPAILIVNRD